MNTVTCPLSLFRQLLQSVVQDGAVALQVRAGLARRLDGLEWLLRGLAPAGPRPSPRHLFRLALHSNSSAAEIGLDGTRFTGLLLLGSGASAGRIWGLVRAGCGAESVDRFRLVGAGMHELPLEAVDPAPDRAGVAGELSPSPRWSRTVGALGGSEVWQRLTNLRIAVIGCGRSGSLMAMDLARIGVRHLTLIDPDRLEPHNLGEMDGVTPCELGEPKAEALAWPLRAARSDEGFFVEPILSSVAEPVAYRAARCHDVLVCCADNDAARLASAIVATLYHRPLIDVGTGISYQAENGNVEGAGRPSRPPAVARRTMGADVRLIVPGTGCLLCQGGLSNYGRAVEELTRWREPAAVRPARPWNEERAGSLRSLNQLAVSLAMRMLEDLVAERIQSSMWAHAEVAEDGRVWVSYPLVGGASRESCPLCARAGLGDEGLGE
jgi:hypothetical protein